MFAFFIQRVRQWHASCLFAEKSLEIQVAWQPIKPQTALLEILQTNTLSLQET